MRVKYKYSRHARSQPYFYKQSSDYILSYSETIHEIIIWGVFTSYYSCCKGRPPLRLFMCMRNRKSSTGSTLNHLKWNASSTSLHLHKMIAFSSLRFCTIPIYFGVIRPCGERFVQSYLTNRWGVSHTDQIVFRHCILFAQCIHCIKWLILGFRV